MGRKGVSKRKSKKVRPFSSNDINGSSNARAGERPLVQTLVKDKGALLDHRSIKPSAGLKKTHNKR